jgi:hypothetical protein
VSFPAIPLETIAPLLQPRRHEVEEGADASDPPQVRMREKPERGRHLRDGWTKAR